MYTETLKDNDDVIGIACDGKLTERDMKCIHALLHGRLAESERLGLVVDLTNFDGYAGLFAALEDFRMDTSHRNDFSRIAVIGDEAWMDWGTKLASTLTRSEIRWFSAREHENAGNWARGE